MSEEDRLKTNNEKVTINDYYYYYLLKCENALNELEKWLDKEEKLTFNSWNKGIHEVQRKLQELKGE